tara:strand:+ start:30 stop:740 length:711 start_codon:yes stop_codon:yes gene_type:complete
MSAFKLNENYQDISKIETHNSLLKLGAAQALKQKEKQDNLSKYNEKRRSINTLMNRPNKDFMTLFSMYIADQKKSYLQCDPLNPMFSDFLDDIKFIIIHLEDQLSEKNNKIKLLDGDIKDLKDENEESINEYEEIEKTKNDEIDKLTQRVHKIRTICMEKNKKIMYHKFAIAFQFIFLVTISIFGFSNNVQFIYNVLYSIFDVIFTLSRAYGIAGYNILTYSYNSSTSLYDSIYEF